MVANNDEAFHGERRRSMDTNKTPEEELAEAQAAFQAAQEKLRAAQERIGQEAGPFVEDSSSPFTSDGSQSSPINEGQTFAASGAQAYSANRPQQSYTQSFYGSKDHVAAGLLAIFLGWLGLHKFYLGYNTQGFIMLGVSIIGGVITFSLAVWAIWIIGIVEGIIYLSKNQTEFDQIYVQNQRLWF